MSDSIPAPPPEAPQNTADHQDEMPTTAPEGGGDILAAPDPADPEAQEG